MADLISNINSSVNGAINSLYSSPSSGSSNMSVPNGTTVNSGPMDVAPTAKSTSVVSSGTAASQATGPIQSTVTNAQNTLNAGGLTQAQADERDAAATTDMKFLPGSGKPNPNYAPPTTGTGTTTNSSDQATTDATNAINHPNQTQLFDSAGQQQWVDNSKLVNGNPPSGYTTTDPQQQAITNSVQDANGGTVNQYANGTYGYVDMKGNYQATTATVFQNAQLANTAHQTLVNLQNGILTPAQQAQVDALKVIQQNDMSKLLTQNANATGAQTIAQNMYGMGNSLSGQGEIQQVITDGANKVTALQAAQTKALADMNTAFETDDMKLLTDAYTTYSQGVNAITKQIADTTTEAQNLADKQYLQSVTNAQNLNNKYSDLPAGSEIQPGDSPQAINEKLQNSTIWQNTQTKNAALTTSAVNKANSTTMNLTDAEIATAAQQIENNGNPSSILAGYGRGDSPNRLAIMKKVMDDIGSGAATPLAFNAIDFKYASNPGTLNTLKYLGSLTGMNGQPGNLDELLAASNSIDRTSFPAINSAEFKVLEQTGNPDVIRYATAVTEVSDQIAKILQGGGTGNSTSDSKLQQAQDLFNTSFTKDQITEAANTLKTLLQNRKDALIGTNQFLQEYESHPTSSGGTSSGGGQAQTNSDGTLQAVSF